jgi:putative oxidoreductase
MSDPLSRATGPVGAKRKSRAPIDPALNALPSTPKVAVETGFDARPLAPTSRWPRPVDLLLRLVPALIMAQTLYFKFGGDPSAIALFTKLGVEPWGRLATGALEALAVLLLLAPGSAFLGAALTLGLMVGALASHLAILGIEVENDGGLLFALALVCALSAALLLFGRRRSGLASLRAWGVPLPAWLS